MPRLAALEEEKRDSEALRVQLVGAVEEAEKFRKQVEHVSGRHEALKVEYREHERAHTELVGAHGKLKEDYASLEGVVLKERDTSRRALAEERSRAATSAAEAVALYKARELPCLLDLAEEVFVEDGFAQGFKCCLKMIEEKSPGQTLTAGLEAPVKPDLELYGDLMEELVREFALEKGVKARVVVSSSVVEAADAEQVQK